MWSKETGLGPRYTQLRTETTLNKFLEYLNVDERLSNGVAYEYKNIARRYLEHSSGIISKDSIRGYLRLYLDNPPKTYNNQLDGLRALINRFLHRP